MRLIMEGGVAANSDPFFIILVAIISTAPCSKCASGATDIITYVSIWLDA